MIGYVLICTFLPNDRVKWINRGDENCKARYMRGLQVLVQHSRLYLMEGRGRISGIINLELMIIGGYEKVESQAIISEEQSKRM